MHRAGLAAALSGADRAWALQPPDLPWSLSDELASLTTATVSDTVVEIVAAVCAEARAGDDIVVMSNGGFGGIHKLLCDALAARD